MKKILISLCVLVAVACSKDKEEKPLVQTDPVSIYGVSKWESSSFPIRMHLSEESNQHREIIQQMMSRWNAYAPEGQKFFELEDSLTHELEHSKTFDYLEDEVFGIYLRRNWFDHIEGLNSDHNLAITTVKGKVVFTESGVERKITHVDIVVNDSQNIQNFTNLKDNLFSSKALDLRAYDIGSIILHELGHALGLTDQDRGFPGIMKMTLLRGQIRQNIEEEDLVELKKLYNNVGQQILVPEEENAQNLGRFSIVHKLDAQFNCKHYLSDQLIYQHQMKR